MKIDTQHLEFLISQYVDGTLDVPTRKTIEQQLLTDLSARELYKEQRETQDLLDDLGSRIPLINWNEFESKLSFRLEQEVPAGGMKISAWRRWSRPVAVAASLLLAAGVGYSWHAMQGPLPLASLPPIAKVVPVKSVRIDDMPVAKNGFSRGVDVVVPAVTGKSFAEASVVGPNPAQLGMGDGTNVDPFKHWAEMMMQPGAVAASSATRPDGSEKEPMSPQ